MGLNVCGENGKKSESILQSDRLHRNRPHRVSRCGLFFYDEMVCPVTLNELVNATIYSAIG